jgi:ActR/RegA family two-component response regulator
MTKKPSKHREAAKVSFARDIRPLFRAVDISHMKAHGIKLDDYDFMSDPDNADKVLEALSPRENDVPAMPPGGPYWTEDQLALFAQWQTEGYQP